MPITLEDLSILAALLAMAVAAMLGLDFMREHEVDRLRKQLLEAEARADERLRLLEQDAFGDSWQRRR